MLSFLGLHPRPLSAEYGSTGGQANFSTSLAIFAFTGTIGVTAMSLVQVLGSKAILVLLFGPHHKAYIEEFLRSSIEGLSAAELQKRAEMAHSWRYFVFLAVFALMFAGVPEELLKYLPVVFVRWKGQSTSSPSDPQIYLSHAVAAALGFSTTEMIIYIYAAIQNGERGSKLALTILERIFIGVPGHVFTACLSTILGYRQGFGTSSTDVYKSVATSVLYHGLFDFALFAFSAYEGNVGWIHPTGAKAVASLLAIVVGIQGVLFGQVMRGWWALHAETAKAA